MSVLFQPPETQWTRLDPRYPKMKRTQILIVWPLLIAAAVIGAYLITKNWTPSIILAIAGLPWLIWRYERQGRAYKRWGYAETETDLYITNGLMWRHLTVVPYGRMQVVRVNAGPIERMFGLATVELVTASLQTSASIPGLEAQAAAQLRDRLAKQGTLQQAGL